MNINLILSKTKQSGKFTLFIREIRLRKAKDLLLSTDLNITQVAFEVGFNDPKYFTRVFSEEFNRLPRDFRKNLEHV
jgi:AraC-like DNA-binding protein